MPSIIRRLAPAVVVALILLGSASAASAASFVVNRSDDPDNTTGSCATSGSCSLREAINAANGNGTGADAITFSGVSTVALSHAQGSGQGDLITSGGSLTIDGGTGVTVSVDSGGLGGLLVLGNNTLSTPFTYTLSHLTLDGTNVNTNNGGGDLSISTGGGAATTTATLDHVTLENGTSTSGGGGIQSTGFTTIVDSTVKNNHAGAGGARGAGVDVANGTMSIVRSTISGNTASGDLGGGVEIRGGSTVTAASIANSTITGNSAFDGGGIDDGTGLLKLSYSTVSNNTTTSGTSGALDFQTVHSDSLKADILNNAGTSANECSTTGTITGGFNFIRDASCGTSTANGNHPSTAISLGALGDNGGPTQTQALPSGSAAIDAAQSPTCTDLIGTTLSVDQRGVPRPQNSICDAGAYESVPAPANSLLPSITGTAAVGQTLTCHPGTWSGSPTFAYQWRHDGTAITGATTNTYNVASADAGHALTCHVTATNGGGSNSADSAGVSAPAATGAGGAGGTGGTGGTGAPTITAYVISPSSFRAASSGGSVARARKRPPAGAKVSYKLSEAAGATFTVVKLLPGRTSHGKCQAPSRRNLKGKRCILLVTIGSFTRASITGANSFRFTGRVNGRALAVGNYKLVLQATDTAGNKSTNSNRPFHIAR